MKKDSSKISVRSKDKRSILLLLQDAQNRLGYLPQETIAEVASSLQVSISEVYGVASFYSFLVLQSQGRNVIRICKSLPCHLKNAPMIIESILQTLGIGPGETTTDGSFSFQLTNCIGACDKAPAMMINNDVHGDLTPEKIPHILQSYK